MEPRANCLSAAREYTAAKQLLAINLVEPAYQTMQRFRPHLRKHDTRKVRQIMHLREKTIASPPLAFPRDLEGSRGK